MPKCMKYEISSTEDIDNEAMRQGRDMENYVAERFSEETGYKVRRANAIYGQVDYMYGEALYKPEMKEGNPIRLYSLDEITEIFCKLGLRICNSFADFSGKPSSDNDIQLMVYSIRE